MSNNYDTGVVLQEFIEGMQSEEQDVILWEKRGEQVRFSISEFRGNMYMGIRYWLLCPIDEVWFPTNKGFSIPFTLDSSSRLFKALTKVLSTAEVLSEVVKYLPEIELKFIDKDSES